VSLFKNILVGVDLTRCRHLDSDCLEPITQSVLKQARWLASQGARLTYCAALNEGRQPWHLIDPQQHIRLSRAVEEAASEVLRQLVEQDRGHGLDAHALLASGKGWDELLHQAGRGKHDLVLIGSRDETGLRRMLFGGTGDHLLRQSPCPVWVARPMDRESPRRLLVASDLGPASEAALRLGGSLVHQIEQGRLQVLHVVDYPLDHLWSTVLADTWTEAYHRQVRTEVQSQLSAQLRRAGLPPGDSQVEVRLVEGAGIPDEAILEFIEAQHIDLVILGNTARSGLAAVFLGNVAERLLREVRCSILTVKPPTLSSAATAE
jgi:nucleotide-binding universal stress UspA family protein